MQVKAWQKYITIPTYEIGEPQKNPVFLEKRVYQGSSGVVYPYPVIEKIYDEKVEKKWLALFLENDFLKIMILPELGGRIQMAWDKIKKRHFIYYNQVIKPALVGLTGPWISGGIEFNWPQHHRPTTYSPVDYKIEENDDGSTTIWCSEIERMFRTKGMAGFTLYPDKAYMEIKVQLYNRTPHPQTFLWWANPAVKVNEHYQSVFPPDVHAVFDHGKRDVSTFPIATGTYYKVDYSAGVDISRYKNIPVPTSYMAVDSKYDFIGCYEHDTQGGMLHVANHHISPGKKQWTWGNGDFGRAWDRNLTDEDGPYIELMCGVYTDNQPDFSWLMPYEEKSFSHYFMPYHSVGIVKNATKDVLINLEIFKNNARIRIYTTAKQTTLRIELNYCNKNIHKDIVDLSPYAIYDKAINTLTDSQQEDYELLVYDNKGKKIISWQPENTIDKEMPKPAIAAKKPKNIKHNDQLFLRGLHLEQYRHATFSAADYYLEALNRDPGDVRCNNALGLLEMKRGNFTQAIAYFNTAILTLTERNPNPYDGEPFFNLGLALRFQYKDDEAYNAFYKATWNNAWQGAAYFQLAQLAAKKGNFEEALNLVEQSLIHQGHNHKARFLKAALLRKLRRNKISLMVINNSLDTDPFNFGVMYEKYLMSRKAADLTYMQDLIKNNIHTYIEISLDYFWSGFLEESHDLLNMGIDQQIDDIYPMAWYYLGWFNSLRDKSDKAMDYYDKAEKEKPGTCFPNKLESVLALQKAIDMIENAAMAPYYLGNFFYHNRQYERATELWERAKNNAPKFATAHRNLALAYYNKSSKKEQALKELERAFLLNRSDARVFMELDALYKRMNKSYSFRLQKMEDNPQLIEERDDLYLEKISLLNFLDKYSLAYDLLMKRKFHPWEGGEGKVTGQYIYCLVEMAKNAIMKNNFKAAIDKLEMATIYPHNLGEGKLIGAQENDIFYWLGHCHERDDKKRAMEYWEKATIGNSDPGQAMFYNDQQADKIFYQGLALKQLNKNKEAASRFSKLIDHGREHLNDRFEMDYFAVSYPDLMIWDDDLNIRNYLHYKYLMALGHLGLGERHKAHLLFEEILKKDLYHSGAHLHKKMLEKGMVS